MKGMALWTASYARQIDNTDQAPLIVVNVSTIGSDEKVAIVGYQASVQDGDDSHIYQARLDSIGTLPVTPASLTKTRLTPYGSLTFPSFDVQSTPLDTDAFSYTTNYGVQYFAGRRPVTQMLPPKQWIWLTAGSGFNWMAARIISNHATLTNAAMTLWLRTS